MAKAIMVQGTTSNAGKSFLTAGLCRIFKQDGYKTAPFKSQNMALNSYITADGLEMGRAQVMQAEAAGIEPTVEMNPILLKPTNDTGSQVIVCGEVEGNMSAREYFAYKKNLVPKVLEAYGKLDANYDVICIEGAGSPAEINLKDEDIVNMGMAKMAKAPVLLVADIDRGGVFASLAGTLLLLDDDEKAMVKGLVINKFRGDKTILQPGLDMIEKITGVPVVGVLPYMHLDLDDEDSLTDRFSAREAGSFVDIAVIRVPRISNFTDFNALEYVPGVTVRYVSSPSELGTPDLIILPGTKNTMEDLLWMRQNGMEARVLKHAAAGKPVIGICGGYQMLGQELQDPLGVEHGGTLAGMGLLPTVTVFDEQKVRTRVSGHMGKVGGIFSELSGVPFEGYEIHMGLCTPREEGLPSLNHIEEIQGKTAEKFDGNWKDNVYGTFVHGIFDQEEVAKGIVISLCKAKGLDYSEVSAMDMKAYKESQYDQLADNVRANMDMEAIYKILEEGV